MKSLLNGLFLPHETVSNSLETNYKTSSKLSLLRCRHLTLNQMLSNYQASLIVASTTVFTSQSCGYILVAILVTTITKPIHVTDFIDTM